MKKECSAGYDCDACKPEMSLRDWFAGMALQGILANERSSFWSIEESVDAAWRFSDAMMKEREK